VRDINPVPQFDVNSPSLLSRPYSFLLLTSKLSYRYAQSSLSKNFSRCPMESSSRIGFLLLVFLTVTLSGCGSGNSTNAINPPSAPTFTSTPATSAAEGVPYTYQIKATSPDGGTITFSLTDAPPEASLSGNILTWTPTHSESRAANAFTIRATTPAGASAS